MMCKKELKTLKDLERSVFDQFDSEITTHKRLIDSYDLRQEAIKRVLMCGCNAMVKIDSTTERCGACKRDIWFNNLTEEERRVI